MSGAGKLALAASAVLAAMLTLTGCVPGSAISSAGSYLYTFNCDITDNTYQVYSFAGQTLQGGQFTVPDEAACPQVQDNIAPSRGAAASGGLLEYILDSNTKSVLVLNPAALTISEIDLMNIPGGSAPLYPVSMDMTPDGSTIWVAQVGIPQNTQGFTPRPPQVSVFSTAQRAFTGSFALPTGITPNTIRFSTDGMTAYLSNDGAQFQGESGVPANSSVVVLNVATQSAVKTIATPKGAGSEVISPDGLVLYTIGNTLGVGPNNLTVIDTTTNTVAASVALPDVGIKLFINPTGTRLYVFWPRGIDVFDTATLTKVASIPTVGFSIANNFAYFSADSSTAWFCNCGFGSYYQVDMRTNQTINSLSGSDTGHGYMFGIP